MAQSILSGAVVALPALGAATIRLQASDNLIADLTRLVISAQSNGALADGVVDQISICDVQSILLNGRIFYVRGNNGGPNMPAQVFSALRNNHFCPMGKLRLSSSDTLDIIIDNTGYSNPAGGAILSALVPCEIAGGAKGVMMPDGPQMWMASGSVAVLGAGVPVAIPLIVDDSGILDLSRAVVRGFIPATIGHEAIESAALVNSSVLNQLQIKTEQNLVVGQIAGGAVLGGPLGILAAGRFRNFVDLPAVPLAAGQTCTITVSQFSAVAGVFSWAAPFMPSGGVGVPARCAC